MNYILTYKDAQEIVNKYDNFNFSEHRYKINNYLLSTFDYFICNYSHFQTPLKNNPEITAFDMRGVTFVFDKNGRIWKKFFMLPKFFNINQCEITQYNNIKHKKIKNISVKEDGSLVAFMMLPDENIFCKTIRGFTNEQANTSLNILKSVKENFWWVKKMLLNDLTPLFEYVSFDNRIVLKYSKPEIRFIGLRNNINGEFIPASFVESAPDSINRVKSFNNKSLEQLVNEAKIKENIEGWVVMFEDNSIIKIKTDWYFKMHNLRTENIFKENFIIESYYNEKIDDIISQLDKNDDSDAIDFINNVIKSVDNYSNFIDKNVKKLYIKLNEKYKNDWNEFAKDNYKELFFNLTKNYNNKNKYNQYKVSYILKKTNKLKIAKEITNKFNNYNG